MAIQLAKRYVIGISGGGTHTDFVVVDTGLQELARFQLGPSNFQVVGESTRDVLNEGIAEILRRANLRLDQIGAIGAGLAGVDRDMERRIVTAFFDEISPGTRLILDNDAVPALIAGVGRRLGVIVICGTGTIALGFNAAGQRARTGGWGHYIDQGSGYWIAREALAAIANACDEAGAATALTGHVIAKLGMVTPADLIPWLYEAENGVSQIAQLAANVVALEKSDPIAAGILSRAADALAQNALAVAGRLGFTGQQFPVALSGSIFLHSAVLREQFTLAVSATMPGAVVFLPERDAALGAGMMALEALGVSLPQVELPPAGATRRATERRNPLTRDIQDRPTLDFVTLMNVEDQRVAMLIRSQLPTLAALIDAIAGRFAAGGRIFFTGAGTSGRLAVLDAAECLPTFGATPDQIAGILAGGGRALIHSVEGAEDDEEAGRNQVSALKAGGLDTVIGVAASGSTPFVVGTLREAAERGALTGCVVNAAETLIPTLVQYPVIVPTGAEVIMGSTRLKAGTAQKLVLNMISTGVMMRVGRTFGNLMTDMQMSNVKLRKRAGVIVAEATDLPLDEAVELLNRCDGEMKTAIASARLKIAPEAARKRLDEFGGNLYRSIKA
jgi:N-acetylmuramic acid 6-phosphate etherase